MSKTKQKSIDELLKEALVPEDEQPYEVPENWVWVRLGSFLPPMETRDPAKLESDSFLYVDIDSIDNHKCEIREPKEIAIKEAPSRAKRAIDKGDVIISLVRPYLKNVARVLFDNPFLVASTAFYVCKRNKVTETDYLYYYLITSFVTNYLNVRTKGHNAPSVRNDDFLRVPIPIPPLNEQKRIVDKIERLFAKIDEAKRLIEEVKESVELRRAAILDRAFRGELGTNDHFEAPNQINEKEIVPPNEQPYKVPENWVWVKLKSCLKNLQYGYTASSSASEEGPKYLRITDIQNSRVDWEKVPHCKIDEEQLEKYRLNKGDIVIARTGATTGKSFLIDDVPCAVFASYLIRLTTNDYLDARYLCNYLKSPMYWKQITVVQKGIAQPGANAQIIGGLSLPLPPVREQQRIAEKVDFLLNKLDSEKQLALEIEQKIDLIKQSILSKAFRGELGTNDPSDERALELLKEVLLQASGQS